MSVYDLIDSLCSISDDYVVMDVTMNLPEVSAFDARPFGFSQIPVPEF